MVEYYTDVINFEQGTTGAQLPILFACLKRELAGGLPFPGNEVVLVAGRPPFQGGRVEADMAARLSFPGYPRYQFPKHNAQCFLANGFGDCDQHLCLHLN